MEKRAAAFLTEVVEKLKLMTRVQLAKIDLKGAFINITTSLSISGSTDIARLSAEELIEKYKNTQTKMGDTMQEFVHAIEEVEERDFSW